MAAMSDDDVRRIMDRETEADEDKEIPQEGYTVEVEKLNQIIDSMNSVRYIILQALSSKGSKNEPPKPVTRPKTAFDKLLEKRKLDVESKDMQNLRADFGF